MKKWLAVGGSLLGLAACALAACDSDDSSGGSGTFDSGTSSSFDSSMPSSDSGTSPEDASVDAASDAADSALAVPGRSLQFDPTTAPQVVTIPDTAALDLTSALTWEAWIKPASSSAFESVLMKPSGTQFQDTVSIWFQGDLHAGINAFQLDDTYVSYTWPAASLNSWHHIAFTYDDATTDETLYIDGVVVGTMKNPNGTPSYDPTHPFLIGSDFDTGGFAGGFDGLIDDVRMFSSVRTAAQIASDMSGASPLGEPSLVLYLPFNEGSGTTTTDLSPNHFVGTFGTALNLPSWASDGAPF